ncbi:hypothetical protein CsSME_00042633 [Camellia sinensis var. sinensis]
MPIPVGGTFTQMLTQSQSPNNTLIQAARMYPQDYPSFNYSQSYTHFNASEHVHGCYSAGASPSAPIMSNPLVRTTPSTHWTEECPIVFNGERTTETATQLYVTSDDTVPFYDEPGVSDEDFVEDFDGAKEGEDNESSHGGVEGHDEMQDVQPIIHFYNNVHFDNDGSIISRDVVERWPLWDSETADLKK